MSSEYDAVKGIHDNLYRRWVSGEKIEAHDIGLLIRIGRENSAKITNIEDRDRLRYMLRFWASHLTSLNEKFPDIDIDTGACLPKVLTSRAPVSEVAPVGSYRALAEFYRQARKRASGHLSDTEFARLLGNLGRLLPGAIEDVVRQQRRSRVDVLADMAWAVTHNVRTIAEYMDEQAEAGASTLKELWICARQIFDLDPQFYNRTVRQNLLDNVNYCYFVQDISQFEQVRVKVQKDKKLGQEHLKQLSCISLSGPLVDLLFLFDFALWNPRSHHAGGRFAFWDENTPNFYPFVGKRAEVARDLLNGLQSDLLQPNGNGRINLDGFAAQLESKGWLN